MIHLSLVIPAYNEEDIIKNSLNEVISFLKKKKYSWEVIVVDDGSKDKTSDIVKKFANKNVSLLTQEVNGGKGAALKRGVLEANGEYIIFSDADLSVPIKYVDDLLDALEKNDMAIGSRRVEGSKIKVHQPWLRENMGRVFTKLTQIVLGSSIVDFTCGFKGFRSNVGKKIFSKSLLSRWAYDSEILFLASKFKYSVAQVPVEWMNRFESRVQLKDAVVTSFLDLLKIRLLDFQGKYED